MTVKCKHKINKRCRTLSSLCEHAKDHEYNSDCDCLDIICYKANGTLVPECVEVGK